jgi:hypothetical protein
LLLLLLLLCKVTLILLIPSFITFRKYPFVTQYRKSWNPGRDSPTQLLFNHGNLGVVSFGCPAASGTSCCFEWALYF